MKKVIKSVIAFSLGIIFTTAIVYAATVITGSEVEYIDNTNLGVDNVQDALDKIANKADIRNWDNIVSAYKYSGGTSTLCVTGEEDTCVKTDCYKDTTAGSCPAATIIKYKVNDTNIVTFHVMYDNGDTLTMQSQKNIVYNIPWISAADYQIENTDSTSCGYTSCIDEGPVTILEALESVTAGWNNVNNQTYTMGTTLFKDNAFTGCSSYNECTTSTYSLESRTVKARIITIQEANDLGCTEVDTNLGRSCPRWMYNYLSKSTNSGGVINDTNTGPNGSENYGYWTLSTSSTDAYKAWHVGTNAYLAVNSVFNTSFGARAVVEINK